MIDFTQWGDALRGVTRQLQKTARIFCSPFPRKQDERRAPCVRSSATAKDRDSRFRGNDGKKQAAQEEERLGKKGHTPLATLRRFVSRVQRITPVSPGTGLNAFSRSMS